MKHCILVKFNDTVADKDALCAEIRAFFAPVADEIPGVHGVAFRRCVIDRPNRYDFLIQLDMEKEMLPAFDASRLHAQWKKNYGERLAAKAIFDFEDGLPNCE